MITRRKYISKGAVCCFIAGTAIIVLGIVMAATRYPQHVVDQQMRKHLIPSLDSPTYDQWVNPPPPLYMKFYVFNVTNRNDVINGKKPMLKEHGPYTFRMYVPRFDIAFYTNDTVSFRYNHTIVFQPELSSGKLTDLLYHINMPLVTLAAMMENLNFSQAGTEAFAELVQLIGEKDLVTPHTVQEILFGYVDPFFELLNDILFILGMHYDPVFAPFHTFNNSDDGVYLTNTGKSDYFQTNEIERWNGAEDLSFWSEKAANMINGTDGTFFRPHVKKTESRYIYFSDMCRSLKLTFESLSRVKGVDTYRFHYADDLFANSTVQPANAGFCVPPDNCYNSGVMNASPCRQGAPAFLSNPHFYNAAPEFQNGVNGLNPLKDQHDSIYDVEPVSGVVFNSTRNVQINVEVKKSRYITQMKKIRNFMCPILWLGGVSEMDDVTAAEFRQVNRITKFMNGVAYMTMGIGLLVILSTMLYIQRKYKKSAGRSLLVNEDED